MENFDQFDRFLNDEKFIAWVTQPTEQLDAYWEKWVQLHGEEADIMLQAKEWVENMAAPIPKQRVQQMADAIWEQVDAHIQQQDEKKTAPRTIKKNRWYAIAASVMSILAVSSTAYYFSLKHDSRLSHAQTKSPIQTEVKDDKLHRTNITAENKVVYLVDGSKITLEPGASIKHITFLQKDKREIDLQGSAFFEVAKDAARPFYVYTNNIVLRVLGTSFNVTAGKNKGDVNVLVHTGQVAVYRKDHIKHDSLVLTPQQEIKYEAKTQTLIKSIFKGDLASNKPVHKNDQHLFSFDETPVAGIFSVMQDAYGIPITFDEKKLNNYKVTSYMGDENFEQKIAIICGAINANYTIEKNKVTVESK